MKGREIGKYRVYECKKGTKENECIFDEVYMYSNRGFGTLQNTYKRYSNAKERAYARCIDIVKTIAEVEGLVPINYGIMGYNCEMFSFGCCFHKFTHEPTTDNVWLKVTRTKIILAYGKAYGSAEWYN